MYEQTVNSGFSLLIDFVNGTDCAAGRINTLLTEADNLPYFKGVLIRTAMGMEFAILATTLAIARLDMMQQKIVLIVQAIITAQIVDVHNLLCHFELIFV